MTEEVALINDATVWYTVSLFIFLGIFYWKGRKPVLQLLDAEIEKIRHELERAKGLRAEAESALASALARQKTVAMESEAILANAKEQTGIMRAVAAMELKKSAERIERQTEGRIQMFENASVDYVKDKILGQALKLAREELQKNVQGGLAAKLADCAISGLKTIGARNSKAA